MSIKNALASVMGRCTLSVKVCAVILLAVIGFVGVQSLHGATTIATPTGAAHSAVAQRMAHDPDANLGTALADDFDSSVNSDAPDKNGYTENPSGIKEIESIQIKACPAIKESKDALPVQLQWKVEECTAKEQALWDKIIELGAGTPRSEQLRLANTGSLVTASQYLPVMSWSTQVGNFNTAPDLKGSTFSTLLPSLIGTISSLIASAVGWAWMALMFLVTLAFTADVATRAMHFIDFMVGWMGSLFTAADSDVIGILPVLVILGVIIHVGALLFPSAGSRFIGSRAGRNVAANHLRSTLMSFVLSMGALGLFVFTASQAQKNHMMDKNGVISMTSSSEESAISKYVENQDIQDNFANEITDPNGIKSVDVKNRIEADVPLSVLKEPSNWATMSPGWMIGNLFRGINWATQMISKVPLQLSQAANPDPTRTGDDLDTCGVYVDGKRGLFLSTPAAHTYEMASNLIVGMDMLFQRLVLDPYSTAAFGGGSSGGSTYCRALESSAGTTTGTQILAMRASGLYGSIVGLGGMGTVGGEGSDAIVSPGNPWKVTEIDHPANGTLLGADGYPVPLTTYDGYKTKEAKTDKGDDDDGGGGSLLDKVVGGAKKAVGTVASIPGKVVEKGAELVVGEDTVDAAKKLASGDPTGALLDMIGEAETIGDDRFVNTIPGSVDMGQGGMVKYDTSMTALQRIFGPGITNEDGQFEAQAYFASCRPVVGTTNTEIASAWNGVEAAEPTTGDAPQLSAQDCVNDAIIGPYTNGGFGGGSEDDANKVEASAPQKKFLYKPRDADGKRTVVFGFTFGSDGDDRSSLDRLSKNVQGGNPEAKNFYIASTGTYTPVTIIVVIVMLVGVWVIYKYILKMLVGALFSGFLLVGASLVFFGTLMLMVVPASSIRQWFRTAALSVLSSAAATSLVALMLLLIVAMSRVFEFMLAGALAYVFDPGSTFYEIIQPMVVLATVIAAAVTIEKMVTKLLGKGSPSITSWDSVGAISGIAAQPLRNGLDEGQPLFKGYNGKELFDNGKKAISSDKEKETVTDEGDGAKTAAKKAGDGAASVFKDNIDDPNNTEEAESADDGDSHSQVRDDAERAVEEVRGEDSSEADDSDQSNDSPMSETDQTRYAQALGGAEGFDPDAGLNPHAPLGSGEDGISTGDINHGSGAVSSSVRAPVAPDEAQQMLTDAAGAGVAPSRTDLGRNGWNNADVMPDTGMADQQFSQALSRYQDSMRQAVDQSTASFVSQMENNSSELSRMAGNVQIDPATQQRLNEAVNQYGSNLNNLRSDLTVTATNGITSLLSPGVTSSLVERAASGNRTMQAALQSEMSGALTPAIRMYQQHLAREIATSTSEAVGSSTSAMASSVSRPVGAATARAIQEALNDQLRRH